MADQHEPPLAAPPSVDLRRLADELALSAEDVSSAASRALGSSLPIDPHRLPSLLELWRLAGRLQGMADALRMVRPPHD